MKKLFLLFVVLFATSSLWAQRFQYGDLYYNITSDTAAEVTWQKYQSDFNYSGLTTTTIPETVTYYGKTYSVTSIGDQAFEGCSSLISVTIPNSVTTIGWCAFRSCYSLTSITIPNSITSIGNAAFCVCYSLSSPIVIPNGVKSIKSETFSSCYSLPSITISSSVTSIELQAFQFCSSLTSVTIPNSVTSIGWRAFRGCSSLTSVTIGNSVTSIENAVFEDCFSLTKTNYTGDITSWCDIKFDNYSSNPISYSHNFYINDQEIKDLVIPNTVDSIHQYAFYDCSSLTSVTIGNSVTSIGNAAFEDCFSLTKTNYTGDITSWCDIKFDDYSSNPISYSHNFYINDQEVKDLVIPNTVDSIHQYAFYSCRSLNSVTLPNSVTNIGEHAFNDCSSLSSVAIGSGVTLIGNSAFADCTSLNFLRLGTGIQDIAANAFADCTKLYDIYCLSAEPPTAQKSSFANYNAFLHVPCESQHLYVLDVLFGDFKYIECISSDEVSTNDIVINPGTTDVTITWPTEEDADTYTIMIEQDGEVVCTLTFNSEGQLLNIAFAPGRGGNRPVQYAEAVANGKGFRFTVTGLEEGTDYTYDIIVKDSSNKTINSYSGKFTTEPYSAVDNTYSQSSNTTCQKLFRNGQLIILRDGVEYNAMGAEIR